MLEMAYYFFDMESTLQNVGLNSVWLFNNDTLDINWACNKVKIGQLWYRN